MTTALITGITGQDGSYLAELLLGKGYEVHGVIRRSSSFNTGRIDHIFDRLHLHHGDLLDPMGLRSILSSVKPDEVYNLAAQSHVKTSFDQPVYTFETVANGTLHMLEAIRDYRDTVNDKVRFYQASSSEMFGESHKLIGKGRTGRKLKPQDETTRFEPASPYACGKVAAFELVRTYRRAYGLFAANGILFNHESPRRGETFVTRKITRAVGRIYYGLQKKLYLGNLDAKRDWGFAGDYVDAMWRMLQQDKPDDFVIATGVSMSVRGWLELAFSYTNSKWEDYVVFDDRYLRPTEVSFLQGDASKAEKQLGWKRTTPTILLCDMMVKHDMQLAEEEMVLDRHRLTG